VYSLVPRLNSPMAHLGDKAAAHAAFASAHHIKAIDLVNNRLVSTMEPRVVSGASPG
jgi:hypothetical protein